MIAVLLLLLLGALAATAEYTPLTLEEAREYVTLLPEAAAADIVAWDAVQHATPVVTVPQLAVIVAGSDVAVSWIGPLEISIADGALLYRITLEPRLAKDVVPRVSWWVGPAWAAGGAVAGVLATLALVAVLR
jgi:hypothetical protein